MKEVDQRVRIGEGMALLKQYRDNQLVGPCESEEPKDELSRTPKMREVQDKRIEEICSELKRSASEETRSCMQQEITEVHPSIPATAAVDQSVRTIAFSTFPASKGKSAEAAGKRGSIRSRSRRNVACGGRQGQ